MKKLVLVFISLLSFMSNASESGQTTIVKTMMDSDYSTKLFINVGGNITRSTNHCHQNATWDFVLDTGTEFGKQMLSQLLMALAAEKKVKLFGSDTCIVNGTIEGLKRIEIL